MKSFDVGSLVMYKNAANKYNGDVFKIVSKVRTDNTWEYFIENENSKRFCKPEELQVVTHQQAILIKQLRQNQHGTIN